MSTLMKKIITGMMLAAAFSSIHAQAQIETSAIGRDHENFPPADAIEHFTGATPCYIQWSKDHPGLFDSVAKILKESGFNITDDDSAECVIQVTGYVTGPSKGEGSVPINLVDVLTNRGKFKDVGPALQPSSKPDAAKAATKASGMTGQPIDAAGISAMSQIGGAMNSTQGGVVGAAIGTLVNVIDGIQARRETPSGVAYVNVGVMFGGFFKRTAFAVGAYAASTTPELPENLVDASVKRVAQAIWEHTAAFDKAQGIAFTIPTAHQGNDSTGTASAQSSGK